LSNYLDQDEREELVGAVESTLYDAVEAWHNWEALWLDCRIQIGWAGKKIPSFKRLYDRLEAYQVGRGLDEGMGHSIEWYFEGIEGAITDSGDDEDGDE